MLLSLFVLFSLPLGGFCAWFAYKAHRVGKRDTAISFSVLALGCLLAGGLAGGWALMLLERF